MIVEFRNLLELAQAEGKSLEDFVDDAFICGSDKGQATLFTQVRLWLHENHHSATTAITTDLSIEDMISNFKCWLKNDVDKCAVDEELSGASVGSLTLSYSSLQDLKSKPYLDDAELKLEKSNQLIAHFHTSTLKCSPRSSQSAGKHNLTQFDVIRKPNGVLIWDRDQCQPFALITPPALSPGLVDKQNYFTHQQS